MYRILVQFRNGVVRLFVTDDANLAARRMAELRATPLVSSVQPLTQAQEV